MVHVRLVIMGNIISDLDLSKITHWKSELFTIEKEVKRGILPQKADSPNGNWEYSDLLLEDTFSKMNYTSPVDITLFIIDAPIQDNWLSRILSGNRIVITYYQVKEILQKENIPLENYILVRIYMYGLLWMAKSNKELTQNDEYAILHDYRENCLYDTCGIKSEVIYKCVQPIICEQCKAYLMSHGVAKDDVYIAEREQKKLKRNLYYRLVHRLKSYPIITFMLSCCLAIALSVVANAISECYSNLLIIVPCLLFCILWYLLQNKH